MAFTNTKTFSNNQDEVINVNFLSASSEGFLPDADRWVCKIHVTSVHIPHFLQLFHGHTHVTLSTPTHKLADLQWAEEFRNHKPTEESREGDGCRYVFLADPAPDLEVREWKQGKQVLSLQKVIPWATGGECQLAGVRRRREIKQEHSKVKKQETAAESYIKQQGVYRLLLQFWFSNPSSLSTSLSLTPGTLGILPSAHS